MRSLGTNIRNIREIKNYTQEYMAEKLGISQSTYSKYEVGEKEVEDDLLEQIASILDVKKEQIEQFDDRVIFNNFYDSSVQHLCGSNGTYNNYSDPKVIDLLERHLKVLEEQVTLLKEQLGK